jgi:[histone H3]-lysine36 N-trimethyltransferase
METFRDYVEVNKNVYLTDAPCVDESFPCDCVKVGGKWCVHLTAPSEEDCCGRMSSCINRSLSIECNPRTCPCQESCQNQRFQKRLYAKVEVFPTPGKGFGIRTVSNIKGYTFLASLRVRRDFIFEYVGEVINNEQFNARSGKYGEEGRRHFYFMTLQSDLVIDATQKGSISRFMNHSCNPNCETQKWIVNGRLCIGLFARRDIPAQTELTFNYRCERFGDVVQKCLCGEASCTGFIGQRSERGDDVGRAQRMNEGFVANSRDDVSHCISALIQKEDLQTCVNALQAILSSDIPGVPREFLLLRGLPVLSTLLDRHADQEMTPMIIDLLERLPIASSVSVESCAIPLKLKSLPSHILTPSLQRRIDALFSKWDALSSSYKIPKVKDSSKNIDVRATVGLKDLLPIPHQFYP